MLKLKSGLEAVAWQHDHAFKNALIVEIEKLQKAGVKTTLEAKRVADVSAVLKKYTAPDRDPNKGGFNFEFGIDSATYENAGVFPPYIIDNHSSGSWAYGDDLNELFKGKSGRYTTSVVSRKNNYVSGDICNLPISVYITVGLLQRNPELVAEVILHEVGHAYTFVEYLVDEVTFHKEMRNFIEEFNNAATNDIRINLLSPRISKEDLDNLPKDELTSINGELVYTLCYKNNRKLRSATGSDVYDRRQFEALADEYAVRMGSGVQLAQWLSETPSYTRYPRFDRFLAYTSAVSIGLITIATAIPSMGLIPLAVLLGLSGIGHDIYDNPFERIKRIQTELTGALRDPNLPKPTAQMYLERLKQIQELVDNRQDVVSGLHILKYVLSSKYRKNVKQLDLEKEMERLFNSNLYAHHHALKHLV